MPITLDTSASGFAAQFETFLGSKREASEDVDAAAREILRGVETRGDDALIERLKAEGAASPADLLIIPDAGRLVRAKDLGLLQAVNSSTVTPFVRRRTRKAPMRISLSVPERTEQKPS